METKTQYDFQSLQKMSYLGINLIKHIQNLHAENVKMLMKFKGLKKSTGILHT